MVRPLIRKLFCILIIYYFQLASQRSKQLFKSNSNSENAALIGCGKHNEKWCRFFFYVFERLTRHDEWYCHGAVWSHTHRQKGKFRTSFCCITPTRWGLRGHFARFTVSLWLSRLSLCVSAPPTEVSPFSVEEKNPRKSARGIKNKTKQKDNHNNNK